MMTALGIVLALVATVAGVLWLTSAVNRREREEAPDHLGRARKLLAAGDRPAAFAAAGEAFWSSPSRVYRADEARIARETLEIVGEVLPEAAETMRSQLGEVIEEFVEAESDGGAVSPGRLDPISALLNDVAGDRYLAEQLLDKFASGQLHIDLIEPDA